MISNQRERYSGVAVFVSLNWEDSAKTPVDKMQVVEQRLKVALRRG